MRRLYSTFARGLPGAGLLLLRLVAGIILILEGLVALRNGVWSGATVLHLLNAGTGILLLAGLWTPLAGTFVAIMAWSQPG